MSTNVLLNVFLMTSFSSKNLRAGQFSCRDFHQSAMEIEEQNRLQFIMGIVISCIGLAVFFAPEQPHEFASICQKYNTSNACQVW
ncbi:MULTISPECIES: hypothetical protein [Prochlorococcus]|nr:MULTISPECIES: hypothetical protein [Prochlorococcus]